MDESSPQHRAAACQQTTSRGAERPRTKEVPHVSPNRNQGQPALRRRRHAPERDRVGRRHPQPDRDVARYAAAGTHRGLRAVHPFRACSRPCPCSPAWAISRITGTLAPDDRDASGTQRRRRPCRARRRTGPASFPAPTMSTGSTPLHGPARSNANTGRGGTNDTPAPGGPRPVGDSREPAMPGTVESLGRSLAQENRTRTEPRSFSSPAGEQVMLHWTVVLFIMALVAALFAFTGIASGAVGVAQIVFFIFIALFLLSLIFGLAGAPVSGSICREVRTFPGRKMTPDSRAAHREWRDNRVQLQRGCGSSGDPRRRTQWSRTNRNVEARRPGHASASPPRRGPGRCPRRSRSPSPSGRTGTGAPWRTSGWCGPTSAW